MNDHPSSQLESPSDPWVEPVDPSDLPEDRAEYARRLIAARCPELTAEEIEPAVHDRPAADAAQVVMVPHEVAEKIFGVLDLIVARLDRLESRLDGRGVH
jgi:hypothetical protein